MPEKGENVSRERKIKSPFIIYPDFKSVLVPENNVRNRSVLYK